MPHMLFGTVWWIGQARDYPAIETRLKQRPLALEVRRSESEHNCRSTPKACFPAPE